MGKFVRVLTISVLGLAYVVAMPLVAASVSESGTYLGKAFADNRDVGHAKGDKGKQDTGKG